MTRHVILSGLGVCLSSALLQVGSAGGHGPTPTMPADPVQPHDCSPNQLYGNYDMSDPDNPMPACIDVCSENNVFATNECRECPTWQECVQNHPNKWSAVFGSLLASEEEAWEEAQQGEELELDGQWDYSSLDHPDPNERVCECACEKGENFQEGFGCIKARPWTRVLRFFRGKRGKKGTPGDPGEPGKKGFPGPVGQRGPTGNTGRRGPQGPKGSDGTPGHEGAQGPQGDWGEPGPRGPRGHRGKQGPHGPPGDRGEIKIVHPKNDWHIIQEETAEVEDAEM